MTMDDGHYTDGQYERGREAFLVLLAILLGGLTLFAAADRLLNIGTLGNIPFAALPLLAAVAAAARLHHGERG